ncbi:MAG: hypothetical protein Q9187_000695 [Circinaria calcarea]
MDRGFDPMALNSLIVGLAAVGLYAVGSKVFSFLRLLSSLFVLPGKPLHSFGPKGSWALVTGASDGIGREFALQLARRGFNILLVSRTASKLNAVSEEIAHDPRTSSVQVKTFPIDFNSSTRSDYADLQTLVSDLDVSILVNSAGISHDIPVPFALTEETEISQIITTNCTGTLRITSLVLPGMLARRRGLVLTMGSFGGLFPTPLLAPYSGSKAFLQQWSSALGAELAPHNITVELVQSYFVTSNMSKIRKPSMLVPTPKAFVQAVLGKVGRSGGAQGWAYTSTPYWSHALIQWISGTFLGYTNRFVVDRSRIMGEDIRKKALRKRERAGAKKEN